MSKSLMVPTTQNELTKFIDNIFENAARHGVNVYCIMGYSPMLGRHFCIDTSLVLDPVHLMKYMECVNAFVAATEDTLSRRYGPEHARELMKVLGQKIIDGPTQVVSK